MKDTLKPGLVDTARFTIDRPRTIGFMGEDGRVYATPSLIADIEQHCRRMLQDHLDTGEDSVGTRVEIDHLAATPESMNVKLKAAVESVDGRQVTFSIEAEDGIDKIARGTHSRFVVDVAKSRTRIADKLTRARQS